MFEYFKRIEGEDGRAGSGYRKRLQDKINSLTDLEDLYNIKTLLSMAKPLSELSVPKYYAISVVSDEYEAYLRDRYFMGLTVNEFENDPVIMKKFKKARERIIRELEEENNALFTDYEIMYDTPEEYGNAPNRDNKNRKPGS